MVAYALKKNLANKSNYGSKRKTSNIKEAVISNSASLRIFNSDI